MPISCKWSESSTWNVLVSFATMCGYVGLVCDSLALGWTYTHTHTHQMYLTIYSQINTFIAFIETMKCQITKHKNDRNRNIKYHHIWFNITIFDTKN